MLGYNLKQPSMTIRNHSALIKLKYFALVLLSTLSILILVKFYRFDFDWVQVDLSQMEIFGVIVTSAIPALQINKVKYVVSKIDNTGDFLNWLDMYFKKFEGKAVYRTHDFMIFEVVESSKRIFKKRETSYYKVKILGNKASIEGPSYKRPKWYV